jgi:hypothetical protein
MKLKPICAIAAAICWLLSGIFWALSASVEIRDSLNAFIGDLQRAGYWNAWAARSACAAAFLSFLVAFFEVRDKRVSK